jgi:hypothetical protein
MIILARNFKRTHLLAASLLFIFMSFGGTGCASITRGTKDNLQVTSVPSGAQVKLSTGQTGTTPVTFTLPRKKGLSVEVSKTGYTSQTIFVNSKFATGGGVALAGNALFGGLIGAGVDGLTGATLSLKPNPVSVNLIQVPSAPPVTLPEPTPAAHGTEVIVASEPAAGASASVTSESMPAAVLPAQTPETPAIALPEAILSPPAPSLSEPDTEKTP